MVSEVMDEWPSNRGAGAGVTHFHSLRERLISVLETHPLLDW